MAGSTGQKKKSITQSRIPSPKNDLKDFRIKLEESGHVQGSQKALVVRIFIFSVNGFFAIYRFHLGIRHYIPFIISTIIPVITIVTLLGMWF